MATDELGDFRVRRDPQGYDAQGNLTEEQVVN